jgi:hypothetical protein
LVRLLAYFNLASASTNNCLQIVVAVDMGGGLRKLDKFMRMKIGRPCKCHICTIAILLYT